PAPPLLRALPARHQPLRADRGQLPGESPSGRGVPPPPSRARARPPPPPPAAGGGGPLQGPARALPLAGGRRGRPQPDGEDAPPDPARAARAGDPPRRPAPAAQGIRRQELRRPPRHRAHHTP